MRPCGIGLLGVALLCCAGRSAMADCLTTLPPNPLFTPPAQYPTNTGQGFWYGTNALWVKLPLSHGRVTKGIANKLFVWSQGFHWQTDPKPYLIVTGKRLDGDAPAIAEAGGTSAYSGAKALMLSGVVFPTEGCWELSIFHAGHVLTFVLSVGP